MHRKAGPPHGGQAPVMLGIGPDNLLDARSAGKSCSVVVSRGGGCLMRGLRGIRIVAGLLVAVLLPVEQARCALMSLPLLSVAVETIHDEAGDHHHGHEPSSAPTSRDQADPCCYAGLPLPAATAPAAISLPIPASASTLLAATSASGPPPSAGTGFSGLASRSRAGPPPDPSSSPQSPRGPPYSA